MPVRLTTTVNKISSLHNSVNSTLLCDLYQYMKSNGASDSHQNNCLKTLLAFATFIGPNKSFYDITRKEHITAFLDTKVKSSAEDPDRKWITTWNDYLGDIKYFFRWLINQKMKEIDEGKNEDEVLPVNWETPTFVQIMKKKTKRLSPYSNTEIWDLDELLTIVKYEHSLRNKAALTLFWDLNGRNHEITTLKVGNIRLSNDLKMQILAHNGIISEESTMQRKPSVLNCYRCSLVNVVESKFCSGCSYPLYPDAYDEIKANEDLKLRNMQEQYERDLKSIREEMNQQFGQIMSIIRHNPKLSQIKPEVLLRNSVIE
jgi:hypothetical protein